MAIINRKGTVSAVRQNSQPNNSSKISQMIGNVANNIRVGRVVDIVLDEKHDSFKKVGRWNGICTIFFEYIEDPNSSASPLTDQSPLAIPLLPNNSYYPLINEIVILIPAPSNQIGKGLNQKTTYYLTSQLFSRGGRNRTHVLALDTSRDGFEDHSAPNCHLTPSYQSLQILNLNLVNT